MDLRSLVQKLGHSHKEIRCRALENIISKLQYNIIPIEELLYFKELYPNLLEFLNRHEEEEKVLNLLLDLSKFSFGSKQLLSLGGVEFFAVYKQDIAAQENLPEKASQISDQLFFLHVDDDGDVGEQTYMDRVYKENHSSTANKYDASYLHNSCVNLIKSYQYHKVNSHKKDKSSMMGPGFELNDVQISKTSLVETINKEEALRKAYFNWIPLTSGDRQILAVTDSRLQSASTPLISQSCEFFKFILLHDFPAEVFIQRPSILKSLLVILSTNKTKHLDIVESILTSLLKLCKKLLSRFIQNKDADVWQKQFLSEDIQSLSVSTNQTQSSSLNNTKETDGCNCRTTTLESHEHTESCAHHSGLSGNDETGSSDMETSLLSEAFQQSQMHVETFLMTILSWTVDLFTVYKEKESLFTLLALLHFHVVDFLKLIGIKASWENTGKQEKTNVYALMSILGKYNEVVIDNNQNPPQGSSQQHSIELKSILLSKIIVKFLNSSIPKDKIYEVVPEETNKFLNVGISKVSLKNHMPGHWKLLETILISLDNQFLKDYENAKRLVKSCCFIDDFYKIFKETNKLTSQISDQKLVECFKNVFPSLFWHGHQGFVELSIAICAERFFRAVENKEQWTGCLWEIMSNKDEHVITVALKACLDLLKEAFSDSLVCNPLSIKHQKAFIFIQKRFLLLFTERCYHKNKEIANIAKNILSLILQSQLCMTAKLWHKLLSILPNVLPKIQGLVSGVSGGFYAIVESLITYPQSILDADGRPAGLGVFERFRASLRMMFHRVSETRRKAFVRALTALTDYDKAQRQMVNYTKYTNASNPEDLLIFKGTEIVRLHGQLGSYSFDSITREDVHQLWQVLNDDDVQENLRQSALEQIAVIMQDATYHELLVEHHNYKHIVRKFIALLKRQIEDCRNNTTILSKKPLLSCLKIIKQLTYRQASVRHVLTVDSELHYRVFQTILMYCGDYEMRFHASCILALLLYDGQLTKDAVGNGVGSGDGGSSGGGSNTRSGNSLTMERFILPYVKLPFNFAEVSINKNNNDKNEGNEDKVNASFLRSDAIREFARASCYEQCGWLKDTESSQISPNLQLSEAQGKKLKSLDFSTMMSAMMETVNSKPTNHYTAIENIDQLKLLLVALYPVDIDLVSLDDGGSHALNEHLARLFGDGFLRQVFLICPESVDDHNLYRCIVSLVDVLVECGMKENVPDMDHLLMSDVTVRIIAGGGSGGGLSSQLVNEVIVKENRLLKQTIVNCISTSLNSSKKRRNASSLSSVTFPECFSPDCCRVIRSIYRDLSITGSESYYDLPLMEFSMECLMHLLAATPGWSLNAPPPATSVMVADERVADGRALCLEIFSWLSQVLVSFHMDRVGATVSFMGKGIVQKCVACLCHLINEIKLFTTDQNWLDDAINNRNSMSSTTASPLSNNHQHSSPSSTAVMSLPTSSLPWLLPLLSDRLMEVRYCGWAISTALLVCGDNKGGDGRSCAVINEFQNLPGGLWAASLGVILDENECFAVRTQASLLLSHLIRLKSYTPDNQVESNVWHNIVVQDTTSKMEIFGVEAFLLLLDHFEFFSEIRGLFTVTHSSFSSVSKNHVSLTDTAAASVTQINASTSMSVQSESSSLSKSRASLAPTDDESSRLEAPDHNGRSSALLQSALLKLLCELVRLSPEVVFQKLFENQVLNVVFSSQLDSFSSRPAQSPSSTTSEVLSLLVQLRDHDTEKWKSVIEQYELLNKFTDIFIALAEQIDQEEISLNILPTLDSIIQFHIVSRQTKFFKDWFNAHALILLRGFCLILNKLVEKMKAKQVIRTIEFLLRAAVLLLQDTVINIATTSDAQCFPVDDASSKSIFADSAQDKVICVGEFLCRILIALWTKAYTMNTPPLVFDAVKCLFMCSQRAKTSALEEGFVETLIEEVKDRLVKLKIESALNSHKELKEGLLDELRCLLEVVRNFMYRNTDVKLSFLDNKFVLHIQHAWSWSNLHERLKLALIHAVTVFSAHCEKACLALCTSPHKQSLDELSFVNHLLKLLIRSHNEALTVHAKPVAALRPCFDVLMNTICVAECRTVLVKANLTQQFVECFNLVKTGNKNQKNTANSLLFYWLRLYAGLTCFKDSAKFIGKIPGFPSMLLSIINEQQSNNSASRKKKQFSLTILRNLMFTPTLKQTLTANSSMIGAAFSILQQDHLQMKVLALALFSMIMYDSEKGKGLLRKVDLEPKLVRLKGDVLSGKCLSRDGNVKAYDKLKTSIETTLHLLRN